MQAVSITCENFLTRGLIDAPPTQAPQNSVHRPYFCWKFQNSKQENSSPWIKPVLIELSSGYTRIPNDYASDKCNFLHNSHMENWN